MIESKNINNCSVRQTIHIRISPSLGWHSLNLKEIWDYRELLGMLAWRDATVRYKQSVVGIGWAVLQPIMTMIIFTVIFGKFAKLPSDGVPYPIFTYCALLPWNYFARSLGDSSDSLVGSSHLITKVYFPRLILPISKVFAGLIDFAIAFVILLAMMILYGISPTKGLLLLPIFILMAMITALGVGIWFTALNVMYRDVKFVVPFLIQFWMYASPVAYSTSLVPEQWQWLYSLNPMVGVIVGFRWALLGKAAPDILVLLVPVIVTILILISGLYFFKRMEKMFADII